MRKSPGFCSFQVFSSWVLLGLLGCASPSPPPSPEPSREPDLTSSTEPATVDLVYPGPIAPELAARFSRLAMDCVHREYPNKVSRTMESDAEVGPPRELFPAFYGCFDWHSSVHGHWLLVRLLRVGPVDAPWRREAIEKLNRSFTEENLAGELEQFSRPVRGSWERPYGLAWFLQLCAELREWDAPRGKQWLQTLEPLEAAIADSLKQWLPKLVYPIRLGTHNQSAFAFGLMLDWARIAGDRDMETLVTQRARAFHLADRDCPLAYEPSGEDFLSPCLMEADLMRRVLREDEFSRWLREFLPQIPIDGSATWLEPGIVVDATDGKLVHLDGVNSSRAWNLYHLARALPEGDPRIASLVAAAHRHRDTGVAAVSAENYEGSHWLASFATYLMTDRGAAR
ncbi:MAG: DUF2891 domain-containing protein [Deltaproteobacteria bacterium]|nr:DUF2891 domain-containing protein [Deltaproteobacteria bacterium]